MRDRVMVSYIYDDEVKIPVYKTVQYEDEFIKVYNPFIEVVINSSKVALCLLFYLAGDVDNYDLVHNTSVVRKGFIDKINKITEGKVNYKDNTVSHAFVELRKNGYLINHFTEAGSFYVNPAYLYKGLEKNRKKLFDKIDDETFKKEQAIRDHNKKIEQAKQLI